MNPQGDMNDFLIDAAEKGDLSTVELMLSRGASKNALSSRRQGITPFFAALKSKHYAIADYLLGLGGIDLSMIDARDETVFDVVVDDVKAGQAGAEDLTVKMLKAASVELLNSQQGTWPPIHRMATCNNLKIVKAMVAAGVDIECRNSDKKTPLMRASFFGAVDVVAWLIANKADINARDCEGDNALHHALEPGGNIAAVEACGIALVEAGVDFTRTNEAGILPLHQAARQGAARLVAAMAARQANLDVMGHQGMNALMISATEGRADCVRVLLEHGADMSIAKDGKTAAAMAAANNHADVTLVFKEWERRAQTQRISHIHAGIEHGVKQPLKPKRMILRGPRK